MTCPSIPKPGFQFLRTGIPLIFLLLPGCSLFRPEPVSASPDGDYVERLVLPRTEQQLERKELVLALWTGPENKTETAAAGAALEKEKIRLKIIGISRREVLSSMLRAGRADLIAGAFTPEEIRTLNLLPVLAYSGTDGKSRYCFAVRRGDFMLENLLGPVSADEAPDERKEK